jgi:hypothetical protein
MAGDSGRSWKWHDLPFESYGALRLEVVDATTLLATSPEVSISPAMVERHGRIDHSD